MLFVKFTIGDPSKYHDFQKVYDHMVQTRQPDFELEEDEGPEFDWDSMTKEEEDKAIQELHAFLDQTDEERRYVNLFPEYARTYFESYAGYDQSKAGVFGFDIQSIFNYLEFSMEVEMTNLQMIKDGVGLVEFSALAFPYGGMERFLITLKAFDLTPIECFNGFVVYKFQWVSEFEHDAIELPEATETYKKDRNYLFL